MPQKITGNLKGNREFVFRQGMGAAAHIAVNITDDGGIVSPPPRIMTYCNRDYKMSRYSELNRRSGIIRNACEECFITYTPEGSDERRNEREQQRKVDEADFPF